MAEEPLAAHSIRFLEMAFRTDRQRTLSRSSGRGFRKGACGDSVAMELRIREDRVQEVAFEVNGCLNTNACANAVAELAEGRTVEKAWRITADDVAAFLRSLPPDHIHCAELVVGAFYRALADHGRRRGSEWRDVYRKRTH
jgi:nitrogen fixation NifU-like protein